MEVQRRTTIILLLIAVALFLVRSPIEEYTCNPKTWHSKVHKTRDGKPISWLQPFKSAGGKNFFATVFQGGGGTPAIFAMLGGQRELISNILWNYTDVIWHSNDNRRFGEGHERMLRMLAPMDAAVTLNPYFLEAWSIYGWHMAWNVQVQVDDPVLKAMWLERGEHAYIRAVEANPDKPGPYWDLAWLYKERRGDYHKAMLIFRKVVENIDEQGRPITKADGSPVFQPMTQEMEKKKWRDPDAIRARYWTPQKYANQLAYCYRKLGVLEMQNEEKRQEYFDKAIETYDLSNTLKPEDNAAKMNADELRKNRRDPKWLREQMENELSRRQRFRSESSGVE